jgi:replicative DNA helicase
MFIYRDEMYHEDTDSKNIAEVIIGKHRNGPTGLARLGFRSDQTKFVNLEVYHEDLGYRPEVDVA